VGQYFAYLVALEAQEPERILYLAMPNAIWQSLANLPFTKAISKRASLRLLIFDPISEEVSAWMDRLNYAALLEQLMLQHQTDTTTDPEQQLILDKERGHYQLLSVGWRGGERVYYVLLHVDLKNNKFWIQQDFTQPSITDLLLEAGVPKSDIVLGFQPPYARALMDFAQT
jgi:XisI protein/XisH protein